MFALLKWIPMLLGGALILSGLVTYPFPDRSRNDESGHAVYAEVVERNLQTTSPDPLLLKVEGLAKSYVSARDNLRRMERSQSVLLILVGAVLGFACMLEFVLSRHSVRRKGTQTESN